MGEPGHARRVDPSTEQWARSSRNLEPSTMMTPRRKVLTALVAISLSVAGAGVLLRREHVVPADGIVGLAAQERGGDAIVVTGSLLASGAKVARTTVTRSDGEALIRIYGAGITPTDAPEDTRGSFAVVIPARDLRSIAVGESANSITVGTLMGLSVRLPRWPPKPSANRIAWRAQSTHEPRSSTSRSSRRK